METQSCDPLLEALRLVRRPAVAGEQSAHEPANGPAGDIGDLFLAEIESRRERLHEWLRLLREQAGLEEGRAPLRHTRGGSSNCKQRGSRHSACA